MWGGGGKNDKHNSEGGRMTDKEEQIAFEQWIKDWGDRFSNMPKDTLWYIYRSMDEDNRIEFLEEAKKNADLTDKRVNFNLG
jgi:hypothetical protein